MSTPAFTLENVDVDGAIQEAAEATQGDTRADFMRKAGIAAGGTLMAGSLFAAMPSLAGAKGKAIPKSDIAILNYALTLEYLEAAFYAEAVAGNALSGPALDFARQVSVDESAHVKGLKAALGKKAVPSPTFDFQGTTANQDKFLETSFTLENTGVKAYLGQAGKIKTPAILLTAASIVTVEARHAGAVAALITNKISPSGPYDKGSSMKTILKAVKSTGFITG